MTRELRIVVLGGAGFIGSYLTNALSKRGHFVFVIDDFRAGSRTLLHQNPHLEIICRKISPDVLEDYIPKSDLVVHLAAMVGVDITMENFSRTLQNLQNTMWVSRKTERYKKPLVFASSSDVYGLLGSLKTEPFREDDLFVYQSDSPRWDYAHVKALEERTIQQASIPSIIFRIFNTYGFGMDMKRPSRVFSRFLESIIFNKPLTIYGRGDQKRAFCYIDDIVDGFMRALEYLMNNGDKRILNLGNDEDLLSVRELAQMMILEAAQLGILGKNTEICFSPLSERSGGFNDVEFRLPDLTQIREVLKYQPKTGIKDGIRRSFVLAQRNGERWRKLLEESPSGL